jgi:hypothetical protein
MGPNNARGRKPGLPGAKQIDAGAIDMRAGGNAIPYDMEDPFIRKEYEATLIGNDTRTRMEPELYDPDNEKTKAWGAATF